MKKQLTLTLCILFAISNTVAQLNIEYLDENNISAGVMPYNFFFNDFDNAKYEVPKGSQINTIYNSAFWLSAYDQTGNLRGGWNTYITNSNDYVNGPYATNDSSANYLAKYAKLYKIKRQIINYHLAHYHDMGYVADTTITQWPAHGDTLNGEPFYIAPFVDKNNDGVYNPYNGDYPDVPGESNIFYVLHNKNLAYLRVSQAMPVDVHILLYQLDCIDYKPLQNTTFLRMKFINRSQEVFVKNLFSIFSDMDIGCSENDYIGCDTLRNTAYAYNATIDSGSNACLPGVNGYGIMNAAQSQVFLNTNMYSSVSYYSIFDTVLIDKKLRYMQEGRFPNNSPIINKGDTVKYFCFSSPTDSTGFSERFYNGVARVPGDRRLVNTTQIDSFYPNQSIVIDVAYVTCLDSMGDQFEVVDKMLRTIDTVKYLYNTNYKCSTINEIKDIYKDNAIVFYPNPLKDYIYYDIPLDIVGSELILTDVNGKNIQISPLYAATGKIAVNQQAGVYIATIIQNKQIKYRMKWIIL